MNTHLLLALTLATIVPERDVPFRAQAEIARRGALVEAINGHESPTDTSTAVAAAMQPPADDSHKWQFTLVVTRNCQWCERARRDFESDQKLKAWVDTKDFEKSWAHWQVVQIEDQSQAWRWRDYRPTAFPTLIVQPPVNGTWGDAHTIVFARQGYLAPAELDASLRKAIQLYAQKVFPQRQIKADRSLAGGLQQSTDDRAGGPAPPVTPPLPLPPLLNTPNQTYPNVPPPTATPRINPAALFVELLAGLIGGPLVANLLLLAILAWQVYRTIAKREGLPLLIDDATANELIELLRSLRPTAKDRPAKKDSE